MQKCKYCTKEGNCTFGWLDSKGVWHSKHYTCIDHAPISFAQQSFETGMEQLKERSRLFNERRPIIFTSGKYA